MIKKSKINNRVFVIHGHDGMLVEQVTNFLRLLKMEPIILKNKANEGKTIIEKLEKNSDVNMAIALLTPDDDLTDNTKQARQNVILELGWFMAKKGRKNISILYKKGTSIPSDMDGISYILVDDAQSCWKIDLAKEFKSVRLKFDFNDILKD